MYTLQDPKEKGDMLSTTPFAAEGRKEEANLWLARGSSMTMTWSSEEIPSYLQFPVPCCRLILASSQGQDVWGADPNLMPMEHHSQRIFLPPHPIPSTQYHALTFLKLSASSCTEREREQIGSVIPGRLPGRGDFWPNLNSSKIHKPEKIGWSSQNTEHL